GRVRAWSGLWRERRRLHSLQLCDRVGEDQRSDGADGGIRDGVETEMSAQVTKAVLLAAGRGTRMRELTNELPKPMIEVRGKPVLQHIVEGLRDAGVTSFLIVVGYRAEAVQNFFGDGSRYKIQIQYMTQVVQDGTGRVVELAK